MFRFKSAVSEFLHGLLGVDSRAGSTASNHRMSSMPAALPASRTAHIVQGRVIRSDPGWYGVLVHIEGRGEIACSIMGSLASNYFGVSSAMLPIEGSWVMVYMADPSSPFGVVMGVMPATASRPLGASVASPVVTPQYALSWEQEAGSDAITEASYRKTIMDPRVTQKVASNAGRPFDVIPGSMVFQNDQHVGLGVTTLAATLKATSRAQIRVSLVDDQVRMVSGHYLHYSAAGTEQTFNDGGYITTEIGITGYQGERAGMLNTGDPAFTIGDVTAAVKASKATVMVPIKPRQTSKKRLQIFMGYLGDLINVFVANPDPDQNPETEDAKSVDQGLAQFHVDSSGGIVVKSAAGLSLQRYDRIPIPKRIRQPWDPEGDKVEDQDAPQPKTPYNFGPYPYGRSALLRDASAYRDLSSCWRIHNQADSTDHKDFFLPEEQDLKTPDDQYDAPGAANEDFKANDARRSFVNLEPDGSIILRDAWGSEIIMAGGNITFSCAGQMLMRSGGSLVAMAGKDLILKANKSVDMTAEQNDVRIKADSKIEIVATGDRSQDGGILLESKSTSAQPWTGSGEDGTGSGVVIKASDSAVKIMGQKVGLSGSQNLTLDTYGEDGQNEGYIQASAGMLLLTATTQVVLKTGSSSVRLDDSTAGISAPSVMLAGGSSTVVTQGSTAMVPLQWADIGNSMFDIESGVAGQLTSDMNGTDWLAPFTPDTWSKLSFSYRTSDQYGTVGATEVQGGKEFTLYQPAWAFMAKSGSVLVPKKPKEWSEKSIDGEYPWPGADARDNAYAVLQQENNLDSKTGIAKARKTLTDAAPDFSLQSIDTVEII